MCLLFILVDMGRPDRFLHIMPLLGTPNWPRSLLAWDALVLNAYLVLNVGARRVPALQGVPRRALRQADLPAARAALDPGRRSRPTPSRPSSTTAWRRGPYWNASILAPRFIASAFCSGPGGDDHPLPGAAPDGPASTIKDEAIWKIAELMAYAMFLNLFLLGAELFKEYYSATEHLLYTQYFWSGLGEHTRARAVRLALARLQRRRVRAVPHPADAAELSSR